MVPSLLLSRNFRFTVFVQPSAVKSQELKWLPNGSELLLANNNSALNQDSKQKTYTSFSRSQDSLPEFSDNPIAPNHPDIIDSKIGPGQEIKLEAHAVKGMGKTHAKWSPVVTVWYRILPEVLLLQHIEGHKAEELVKKCPVKVFDIEDMGEGSQMQNFVQEFYIADLIDIMASMV